MRYVITGAAGFIGSHLARRVIAEGLKPVCIDNLSTGRRENLAAVEDKIDFHEVDILDAAALTSILQEGDIVFHEAAIPSVPRSLKEPRESVNTNVIGTMNVLLAARDKKAKRVLFASSSSVYGDIPGLPKHENVEMNPLSPYAASKLAGEGLMQSFWTSFGLETVTLRYFNVFGARQDPTNQYAAVIPKFICALQENKAPVIFGDGEQSRDFTYIDNVIEGNWLAAHADADTVSGRVMNLSCGDNHTVNSLVAALNRILGKNIAPKHDPPRVGDIRHSYADISRARELLKYETVVDFESGLQKTVDYYTSS